MSNFLYAKAKALLLSAGVDCMTDTLKMALVGTGYTPAPSTDQYYSDIASYTLGTDQVVTVSSVSDGTMTGSVATWPAGTGGLPNTVEAKYLVIYKDTGTPTTSPLLCCMDTGTGLPLTGNGGTVTIDPDSTYGFITL